MILAPLVSLGLALAAQEADPAVIKVEDTVVTRSDLAARLREARGRGQKLDAKQLTDSVLAETVLVVEARRMKFDTNPEVAGELARERYKALAAALTDRLAAGANPSETELKNLFHLSSDTARLKLIVVLTREEAQAILVRLRGGADFAAEALHTLDPGARERKGDSRTLTRGDMDPALAREVFAAKAGALVGPVEQKMGWAVASVIEPNIANEAEFPARRPQLESYLRAQTLYAARTHYLEGRRRQLKVTLDQKFLDGLGARVDMTPAEANHPVATIDGKPLAYREVHHAIRSLAAGATGSHTSGPKMKARVIDEYLNERILADAALAEKLDRQPAVAQAIARAQRMALAIAVARAVAAGERPGAQQAAIDRRVAELRKSLRVWVDEAAVARVIAEQP